MKYGLVLCFTLLTACGHINYYAQAINGQLEIFSKTQPITQLLKQATISTRLKQQLTDVIQIRTFATQSLYLPDNKSYTDYADMGRSVLLWSVFATPALSLKPKQWCFLLIGCLSYQGYFSKQDAIKLAKQLRQQQYDVYIADVPAYSTLGWFNDPLLNTMLLWSRYTLAGFIFHELAHQKLYIANDTVFNESFATAIELIGTERWLAQYGTEEEQLHYQQIQQRQKAFLQLVTSTYKDLQAIYKQKNITIEEKQIAKLATFQQLQFQYQILKKSWNNYAGYDIWFSTELNNAKLLAVITYQDFVPAFKILYHQEKSYLPNFYQQVEVLAKLSKEERHKKLKALIQ
ncbi:MAG: aminopeptidase [Thiomargarita sp.]|nr:aminopeptidase [Thiomargarita sp.]